MQNLKTILLLEDAVADQLYIKRVLFKADIFADIITCDAKEVFIQNLNFLNPDVVLLDYHVPGFDSNEALQITKLHNKDIPVIYVTGAIPKELAAETIINEAEAYVTKESLDELPLVLQSIWLHSLVNREADKMNQLGSRLNKLDAKIAKLMTNNKVYSEMIKNAIRSDSI